MTQQITWVHRTLIQPAATVEDARLLAATLTGPGGEGMWQRALSPTGQEPPTHYISSGHIDAVFAALLPLTTVTPADDPEQPPVISTTLGQPAVLHALAQQAGMDITEARIAAVLDAADVSEQDHASAMARLGVQFVIEEAADAHP